MPAVRMSAGRLLGLTSALVLAVRDPGARADAGAFLATSAGDDVDGAASARRASGAPAATRYVAHLMPWFENTTRTAGNHWCDPDYGNSYYKSVLGRYGSAEPAIIRKQLYLMRAAGIDGVWIDLQFPEWLESIGKIVAEATRQRMNFAIVVDNYAHAGIVDMVSAELQAFMAMPNYYKVYGRAVLPYYEHPERWGPAKLPGWRANGGHRPFVIGTYAAHPERRPLPEGYDSLFFWNSPDAQWLSHYYDSPHFDVKVGAVYRGWREAYADRKHSPPYLGYLNETLRLARERRPYFAQLVTWNDYGEGTMLEPSFLRSNTTEGCGDPRSSLWNSETESCADILGEAVFTDGGRLPACTAGRADPAAPCSGSGTAPCADVADCSKPWGAAEGRGAEGCSTGELSAYADLATVAHAVLGTPAERAVEAFGAIAAGDEPSLPPSRGWTAAEKPGGPHADVPMSSAGAPRPRASSARGVVLLLGLAVVLMLAGR